MTWHPRAAHLPVFLLAPLRGHRVRHCHLSHWQPPLANNALSPVKQYLFLLAFSCKSYWRSIESEITPTRRWRQAMGEWGLSGLLLPLDRCLLRDHTLRVDQGWRACVVLLMLAWRSLDHRPFERPVAALSLRCACALHCPNDSELPIYYRCKQASAASFIFKGKKALCY